MLFEENTFTSNIGLFGGAMTIDSPNFTTGDFSDNAKTELNYKPYIWLKTNTFAYN